MGGCLMPSIALRPEDLLVEYRGRGPLGLDSQLKRQGSIPIDDLRLKMQPVYNGVGAWTIQLPSEHRAASYLRSPGAGIVVTNLRTGETLLSGSTSVPSKKATSQDPKGLTTIAGLTDDRLLWDARAFADPTQTDPALATVANDVRTAAASTLLRQYVSANIGPGSPAGRRGSSLRNAIVLGPDPALGAVTTRRPRYDILGELLYGIAMEAGLGFRLVQVGMTLQFQVYQPVNRASTIRLDIHNGTLQDQEVENAPPEVTRMIVAGQGEGVERQMISRTSARATQAENDWGLIIEEFKDQRNTDIVAELEAAGDERLNEAGFTKIALKAVPSNDQTMIFMTDFFMGDKVSVVVEGQEQPNSIITEAVIVVDNTGLRTALAIGDIADFDSDSYLRQQLTDTQNRVDSLERNAEASVVPEADRAMAGEIKIWPVDSIPAGWFKCNGQAVSRANNPRLFAALGTTYGVGDGSTTFNVPNFAGRSPVGTDAAQIEFTPTGKTGGAKTHTLGATELPAHTHRLGPAFGGNVGYAEAGGLNQYSVGFGSTRNTTNDVTAGSQNGTTGQAHNNLHPYIATNFIIRGS